MNKNSVKIKVNDLFDELREENNRLLNQLLFTDKCIKLLENYRNYLNSFNNNCKCDQNVRNKLLLDDLENQYKSVFCDEKHLEFNSQLINIKNFQQNNSQFSETISENVVKIDSKHHQHCLKFNETSLKLKVTSKKSEKNKSVSTKSRQQLNTFIDYKSDNHLGCNQSIDNSTKCESFNKSFKCFKPKANINKSKGAFQKQLNSDNNLIEFCCNYFECDFRNKSLDLFEQHIDKSHANFNYEPKKYRNNSFRRKQLFKVNKNYVKFKCEWNECQFETNNYTYINEHILRHTGNKQFVCQWPGCESKFINRNELKSHHNNRHSDWRPFSCHFAQCGQKFKSKNHLKVHFRSHTGEKPYVCEWPGCEATFGQSSKLNRHKLIHNGIKNFTCNWPECDKKFITPFGLKRHVLIHSGEKPFRCDWPHCDKRFNDRGNMKKHLRVHK